MMDLEQMLYDTTIRDRVPSRLADEESVQLLISHVRALVHHVRVLERQLADAHDRLRLIKTHLSECEITEMGDDDSEMMITWCSNLGETVLTTHHCAECDAHAQALMEHGASRIVEAQAIVEQGSRRYEAAVQLADLALGVLGEDVEHAWSQDRVRDLLKAQHAYRALKQP